MDHCIFLQHCLAMEGDGDASVNISTNSNCLTCGTDELLCKDCNNVRVPLETTSSTSRAALATTTPSNTIEEDGSMDRKDQIDVDVLSCAAIQSTSKENVEGDEFFDDEDMINSPSRSPHSGNGVQLGGVINRSTEVIEDFDIKDCEHISYTSVGPICRDSDDDVDVKPDAAALSQEVLVELPVTSSQRIVINRKDVDVKPDPAELSQEVLPVDVPVPSSQCIVNPPTTADPSCSYSLPPLRRLQGKYSMPNRAAILKQREIREQEERASMSPEQLLKRVTEVEAAKRAKEKRRAGRPVKLPILVASHIEEDQYNEAEQPITADSTDFNVDKYKPEKIKNLRIPWVQDEPNHATTEQLTKLKNALDNYPMHLLDDDQNDFLLVFERLIPSLASCLKTISTGNGRPSLSSRDVSTQLVGWISYCLSSEQRRVAAAPAFTALANQALKALLASDSHSIADLVPKDTLTVKTPHRPREVSLVESLVKAIQTCRFTDSCLGFLLNLMRLLLNRHTAQQTNRLLRQFGFGKNGETMYSVLYQAAVERTDGSIPQSSAKFVKLMSLMQAWLSYLDSASNLSEAVGSMKKSNEDTSDDTSLENLFDRWKVFESALIFAKKAILEYDDDSVCAAYHIYMPMEFCDIFHTAVRLLEVASKKMQKVPDTLPFLSSVLRDEYFGLMFASRSRYLSRTVRLLRKLASKELADEDIKDGNLPGFDEGFCGLPGASATVRQLVTTYLHRLRALELCDGLKGWKSGVDVKKPPTVDDGNLFAMIKMSHSREGRLAVGFVMAHKFTFYLIEAVQLGARHEGESTLLCEALTVLNIVLANCDDSRYYSKYVRVINDMLWKLPSVFVQHNFYPHLFAVEHLDLPRDTLEPEYRAKIYLRNMVNSLTICQSMDMKGYDTRLTEATIWMKLLEACFTDKNHELRDEVVQMFVRDNALVELESVLYAICARQHTRWQMGEPIVSKAAEDFLAMVRPALRLLIALEQRQGELVQQTSDVEVVLLTDQLTEAVLMLWSVSSGFNGQCYSREPVFPLRETVVKLLSSLGCTQTHLIAKLVWTANKFIHLRPAMLGILLAILPTTKATLIPMNMQNIAPSLITSHQSFVDQWSAAFAMMENPMVLAEILICPVPYIADLSSAFCQRLCHLGQQLPILLPGWLLNFVIDVFSKIKIPRRRNYWNCQIDSSDEETMLIEVLSEEAPKIRRATKRQMRMFSWLMNLCSNDDVGSVLAHNSPSSQIWAQLIRLTEVVEAPAMDDENHLLFQNSFVDFVDMLLRSDPWELRQPVSEPATSEDVPATSEDIPATSEDIPAASEDIPATSEDIPATSEDVPTASGDAEVIPDNSSIVITVANPSSDMATAFGPRNPNDPLYLLISCLLRVACNRDQNSNLVNKVLKLISKELMRTGSASHLMVLYSLETYGLHKIFRNLWDTKCTHAAILKPTVDIIEFLLTFKPIALWNVLCLHDKENAFHLIINKQTAKRSNASSLMSRLVNVSNQLKELLFNNKPDVIEPGSYPLLAPRSVVRMTTDPGSVAVKVVNSMWVVGCQTRKDHRLMMQCQEKATGVEVAATINKSMKRGELIRRLIREFQPDDEKSGSGEPQAKKSKC